MSPPNSVWLPVALLVCLNLAPVTSALGQDLFPFHDNFDDRVINDSSNGGFWNPTILPNGASINASTGDVVITSTSFTMPELIRIDGTLVRSDTEWSIRARMTIEEGATFAGVGTSAFDHAAFYHERGTPELRVGSSASLEYRQIPFPVFGEELIVQMDAFDGQITGSIWPIDEPALRVELQATNRPTSTRPSFGAVGSATFHEVWIDTVPIPEPSSVALALTAILPLLCYRPRARQGAFCCAN